MTEDKVEREMVDDQIRAINGFYTHFMVYVGAIALLIGINLATGDNFWAHWVMLGWGLGIVIHAYLVFVHKPQRLAAWKAANRR